MTPTPWNNRGEQWAKFGDDDDEIHLDEKVNDKSHGKNVKSRSCCTRCMDILVGLVVLVVLVAGIAAGLFYVYGQKESETDSSSGDVVVDGGSDKEAVRWDNRGETSLNLYIMNSMDDRWTPYFYNGVMAWDNGSPDVLNLQTGKFPYDPECMPFTGRVNVCNADYGDTDWRGINIVLVLNDFIEHSVAKLNDFHLANEGDVLRAYTMCHELGHGFGLPHTDEDYNNKDLGDCMDYTTRPQNNLNPGQVNFNLLARLYGGAQFNNDTASSMTTDTQPTTGGYGSSQGQTDPSSGIVEDEENEREEEEEDDSKKEKDKDHGRYLRHLLFDRRSPPLRIRQRYQFFRNAVERGDSINEESKEARFVHRSENDEYMEFELGDGYSMLVRKLLAK